MPKTRSLNPGLKYVTIALSIIIGLVVIGLVLLLLVFPPRISASPGDAATNVNPANQWLEIGTSRWGASISAVTVSESRIEADGTRDAAKTLDGHLDNGRFVAADGSNPLVPDAEYRVTVTGTVKHIGLSGVSDEAVTETNTFTTVTTPMPVIPPNGLVVKYGDDVTLQWNEPVSSFTYQLDGIDSTSSTDAGGNVSHITLAKFEQGKSYPLKITGATSTSGVVMKQPVVTAVTTTAPLTISFDPADGSNGASTDVYPTVNFSEPVSNPDLANSIVTVEPKVDGSFKWTQPNQLKFIPKKPWDHLIDVTVRVKGGPSGFRGIGGGYVEGDQVSTFTTAPEKSIDVNVTSERVTLLENGNPIDSFLCASGADNTPTPLGDFTIYAKMTSVDMRGPGYFAPHVPWVMVFDGDYTLHGNYWNTTFGVRGSGGSHGCVGMPPDIAKRVYDWAPLGTPVHIHE